MSPAPVPQVLLEGTSKARELIDQGRASHQDKAKELAGAARQPSQTETPNEFLHPPGRCQSGKRKVWVWLPVEPPSAGKGKAPGFSQLRASEAPGPTKSFAGILLFLTG